MNDLAISRFSRSLTARAGVFLLFAALTLAATAGLAQAAVTLDVQKTGGTYNSIQDAINAAGITTNTVVIRVAEGTYQENLDIYLASDLTIQGGWNSTFTSRDTNRATVAYGDSYGSEIDISESSITIDGLTVTRGNDSDGGGIDVGDSELTLRNCKVVRNWADDNGGGIWANYTTLVIENSEIAHNITSGDDDDYYGGGLYVYGGSLVIKDSSIHDNNTAADPYDSGDGDGGGVYLKDTSATIERTRILDNSTVYGDYDSYGGGIYADSTNLSLINDLIAGNSTYDDQGGGLYYYQYDNGNNLSIVNSTFSDNHSDGSGGGAYIYTYGEGAVDIRNSVLWGNLNPEDLYLIYDDGTTDLNISYSDIGTTGGDPFTAGPGVISADPLYVNSTDDFRLRAGSPAINTASSAGAPATDLDGIARPQGAGFDMGAFEWVAPTVLDVTAPTATLTTPYISSNVKKNQDFDLSWSGVDPAPSSGGLLFDVWYKIGNGGAWHRWLDWTATTGRRFRGLRGKTYYFKVKAKDAAGNVGAFSSESMTLVPFDGLLGNYIVSRNGFYLNKWTKASNNNYGRTLRKSSAKGEQITYRYKKTNQINLIATLGKGHGKFKVLVDGANKGTVDTKASTTQHRKIVFTVDFASFGTHKIQVVNLGTPGRPTIEMDGIAVRR